MEEKTNKANSSIRKVLIALISDLNEKITIPRIVDGKKSDVKIPFNFSMAGEINYLQDYFIRDDSINEPDNKIEGFYDKLPRGIIQISSVAIDSENLGNRWITLSLTIEEKDELKKVNVLTRNIPIVLNVECTILVDSILNSFLVTEKLIKEIYKVSGTYYDHLGIPVPVTYRFPFDSDRQQITEYEYTEKQQIAVTFSLSVNSFIIDILKDTAIPEDNKINYFNVNLIDRLTLK